MHKWIMEIQIYKNKNRQKLRVSECQCYQNLCFPGSLCQRKYRLLSPIEHFCINAVVIKLGL